MDVSSGRDIEGRARTAMKVEYGVQRAIRNEHDLHLGVSAGLHCAHKRLQVQNDILQTQSGRLRNLRVHACMRSCRGRKAGTAIVIQARCAFPIWTCRHGFMMPFDLDFARLLTSFPLGSPYYRRGQIILSLQ